MGRVDEGYNKPTKNFVGYGRKRAGRPSQTDWVTKKYFIWMLGIETAA